MKYPILNLLLDGDKAVQSLRAKSVNVVAFNRDIHQFCLNLAETMFATKTGVGLSAPQVGRNENIFVMRTQAGIDNDTNDYRILINPYSVIEVGEPVVEREGCLSIPGFFGDVERFPEVGIIYWDSQGNRRSDVLTNLEARIYQHEMDHLNGVLFIDRTASLLKAR